jgi:hypothetical protein
VEGLRPYTIGAEPPRSENGFPNSNPKKQPGREIWEFSGRLEETTNRPRNKCPMAPEDSGRFERIRAKRPGKNRRPPRWRRSGQVVAGIFRARMRRRRTGPRRRCPGQAAAGALRARSGGRIPGELLYPVELRAQNVWECIFPKRLKTCPSKADNGGHSPFLAPLAD